MLFFHIKVNKVFILGSVLFETHHLYYWPNFRPIIDEMIKSKEFDVCVSMPRRNSTIQQEILIKECKKLSLRFITADTEAERVGKIFNITFDIIIVGNVGKLTKLADKNTIAVMVYHGIGLKHSYYKDISPRINIRAVESVARLKELKNQGHRNLFLTGFTKLDRLFTIPSRKIDLIRNNLELKKRETILYAPSFYPSSIEKISSQLPLLSQYYNIIIKLHGFSWEQKRYRYQSSLFIQMTKENKNIKLIPNEKFDIIPYYKVADILVSDISSTLFEFLPLNKPIIQAECFTLRLKHRVFFQRFLKRLDIQRLQGLDFAYKISNAEDLFSRVYFALDNSKEMQAERKKACEYYLYKNDGKASRRLIQAIKDYQ